MSDSRKRKRPPTFQHYPVNRAKQLKKNWVETVKIKSKWKAEKRKEGISKDVREGEPTDSEHDEEEEKSESPPPDAPQIHKYSSIPIPKSTKEQEAVTEPPAVSLRKLTREAYSRSSLHTFKADPLKRRRGAPDRGSGGTRGRGSNQRRDGRGQPNMKLRMNAMLEKIKQDYAS